MDDTVPSFQSREDASVTAPGSDSSVEAVWQDDRHKAFKLHTANRTTAETWPRAIGPDLGPDTDRPG